MALKKARREKQNENVLKKKELKDEKRAAKKARKEERLALDEDVNEDGDDSDEKENEPKLEVSSDIDDAEYYRREVGAEPEENLFHKKPKSARTNNTVLPRRPSIKTKKTRTSS